MQDNPTTPYSMAEAAASLRRLCESLAMFERITWRNVGDLVDRLSNTRANMAIDMALAMVERVMATEALDCSDLNKLSRAVKANRVTSTDLRPFLIAVIEKKDVGSIQHIISDLISTVPSGVPTSRAHLAFYTTERCKPGSTPPSRTLSQILNKYVQDFQGGKYASPITFVVGPLGIGKSASVKNSAISNQQYVCYVSFASENSSAVPARSHAAAEIARWDQIITFGSFKDRRAAICKKWCGFIMAAALDVETCRRSGISPENYFNIQTGDSHVRYADSLINFARDLENKIERPGTYKDLIDNFLPSRQAILASCLPGSCTPVIPAYESIIICLDEAQALLQGNDAIQFRCFTQAIRDMNDQFTHSLFGILLGTTSRISHPSPPVQHDPSARSPRVPEQSGKPFFAPIYTISTFDIFVDAQSFTGLDVEGSRESVTQLFSCGRPLWGALLSKNASIEVVFRLAREKLDGKGDELPLMSQLIPFHILNSTMNAQYLERRMRYICELSPDSSFLSTFQPSEPILANVAAYELATNQHRQLAAFVALHNANINGYINVGDLGEVVAMLVIIFSWASTQYSSSPFPKLITLRQFFQAMYPPALAESIYSHSNPGERALYDHGYVFCNHFVRVFGSINQDLIQSMFSRGAGIIMPANAPGADLILPVKYVDPHSTHVEMGCVIVQVKNRAYDKIGAALRLEAQDARRKLAHLTKDMKHFFVMMCLRGESEPPKWEVGVESESVPRQSRSQHSKRPHYDRGVNIITMGCDSEIFPNATRHGPHSAAVYSILHRLLRWNFGPRLSPDASDEVRDYMKVTFSIED